MAVLKRSLEEEATTHEAVLTDQRHKHSQELQQLNEQHEQLKKAKAGTCICYIFVIKGLIRLKVARRAMERAIMLGVSVKDKISN